jgi:hypothetical protein
MGPESTRARLVRVAVAWLTVAGVRLALAMLPWRIVERSVGSMAAVRAWLPHEAAPRIGARVIRVACFVPGAACLAQALAGRILLAWHGHRSARVRYGVRRDHGALLAHAWLEADGRCVIGGPDVSGSVPLDAPAGAHAR